MMYLRTYQRAVKIPLLSELTGLFSDRGSALIANQDKRVVITQMPKRTKLRMGERLIPADRMIVVYRTERQRLIDEAEKLS